MPRFAIPLSLSLCLLCGCPEPPANPSVQEIADRLKSDPAFVRAVGGAVGQPGRDGRNGDPGVKGPAGERGDRGPAGQKGDPGERGAAGEKGDKGDPGATGATGPAGAKGDSGLGKYCGTSAASKGMAVSAGLIGARAAKKLCEAACADAHVCGRGEVSLSWQSGLRPPGNAWISNPGPYPHGMITISDCSPVGGGDGDQWTDSGAALYGSVWFGGGERCDSALPFACCK